MTWLNDSGRVIIDLVTSRSGQPLKDRLAAADRVRAELPAEPDGVMACLDELIAAAQYTARGIVGPARASLAAALPLMTHSPELGYLVFRVASADVDRGADARDLLLRLLEPARSQEADIWVPRDIIASRDPTASVMLADLTSPIESVRDHLWRAQVLMTVGQPGAAAELLVALFAQNPYHDVRDVLELLGDMFESCVRGRPDRAGRLLDAVTPRLNPENSLSSRAKIGLFLLIDACVDADRAETLVLQMVPDATWEDFYDWGEIASESEFQRAAAMFGCAGLAATGSHWCAQLAVLRLTVSDEARRAIEIALDTDWAPDHPNLELLFSRCVQVAEDAEQLERLTSRAARLGLDVPTPSEPMPAREYEERMTDAVFQIMDRDGPGKALQMAQRLAFSDHKTPAVRVLWVDFYIELGRLDDALELAERLVDTWPEHPLPYLKLSQCLAWLGLRADEETVLIDAADRLARFPKAAPVVLQRLARYNLVGARSRVAAALNDPSFSEVWSELSSISLELLGRDR